MTRNANQAPPEDTGFPLATIARGDGKAELRLRLKEYNGWPFIDARVWILTDDWLPTKQGVTFKPRELDEVIEALQQARQRLEDADRGVSDPRARDRQAPRRDLSESWPMLNNRNNCSQSQPNPPRQDDVRNCGHDDRPTYVDRHRRTEVVPLERRETYPTPSPSPTALDPDDENIPF